MRLHPCDCDAPRYVREPRAVWMRLLLPAHRHWACLHCDATFLATKGAVVARLAGQPVAPRGRTAVDQVTPWQS